jgi:hypothetical protein
MQESISSMKREMMRAGLIEEMLDEGMEEMDAGKSCGAAMCEFRGLLSATEMGDEKIGDFMGTPFGNHVGHRLFK